MIYFDNAATGGRKPDAVLNAVSSALKICANPGRSGHKLSLSCLTLVESCRRTLSDFFDNESFDRVIFTKNCTEALNIALFGVLKKGDHVVVSCMEHNSVLRPLEFLRKTGVIEYDVVWSEGEKENGNGNLTPAAVASLIKPNTKLVCITSASNVNGVLPPLNEIRKAIPKRVFLLCDGAQGGGHIPLQMRGAGIDLLTIAGHKGMHGIQGSGALLFSDRVEIEAFMRGGTGSISLSLETPDFYPDKLEAGTLAFPAIVSLLEGTRYVKSRMEETQEKLTFLSRYFLDGLNTLSAYTAYSKPNPCGIVAFSHKTSQSERIADLLSTDYGIAVRGGLHCAPFMHEDLGTLDGGLVRASFSLFNEKKEIDDLLFALHKLQ